VRALDDATLSIVAGEVRALLGANGAGKSTLVKILTGLVAPDAGEVLIDGAPLRLGRAKESLSARIAAVPQELTVAPSMTVGENVLLGHEPQRWGGVLPRTLRRRAREVLASLGVDVDVDAPVGTLRLIEQRLVMVARALSYDARLVIFDEPTATVAPLEVDRVLGAISSLAERGVSVLYVSHRLAEVERICDSVTVLRDGVVVADLAERATHRQLVALLAPEREATESATRRRPSSERGRPVLVVRGLTAERLRGIDLVAHAGEVVGLAGLAGSGARELVLALIGAIPATAGTIEVDGKRVASGSSLRSVRSGMGFLPGDRALALFANHSVRHNVSLSSLARHALGPFVNINDERASVTALLERVRLRASQGQAISSLSGGNQQKALVARWIASKARVPCSTIPPAGGRRPAEIHRRDFDSRVRWRSCPARIDGRRRARRARGPVRRLRPRRHRGRARRGGPDPRAAARRHDPNRCMTRKEHQ
jgi:ABC-type sugar transport system ATPase subunit